MADAPPRRAYKRLPISDQHKRRLVALERQKQERYDLQRHFRQLESVPDEEAEADHTKAFEQEDFEQGGWSLPEGSRLQGADAKHWFARQFMLPEWMIDIPSNLTHDWYVMCRPAGRRCLVVSSRGTTISRLRDGRVLHRFPSLLPNGARTPSAVAPSHVFCILDCIFHEADQTYYVLDLTCWRGYSLYDCATDFRLFWRDSKLAETDAFCPPSAHHYYRFSLVPVFECDAEGLRAAYCGQVPYQRDGLLFYNRNAHYTVGYTPLALLWKDPSCSQYYLDTNARGEVPALQQVVLELKDGGAVGTSDDPPVLLGSVPAEFLNAHPNAKPGTLLRFSVATDGLRLVDGRPVCADIHYEGLANRYRPAADSCTKILFQYAARHSPFGFNDILSVVEAPESEEMDL